MQFLRKIVDFVVQTVIIKLNMIKKRGVKMTRAYKRYFTSSFLGDDSDITLNLIETFKNIHDKRIINLPEEIPHNTKANAIYSYGDVLLFEIAMIIKGDDLKDVAHKYSIDYYRLRRVVEKFGQGEVRIDQPANAKANAYIIQCMIHYTDKAKNRLEKIAPQAW